ncbi:MAG: metal ABC transporter permease [Planctomycetota bacterium]|nr:metal ABC transporter permease [Planctomycetota bacterium]
MNLLPESLAYMAAPMAVCVSITALLTYLGAHVLRREVIFVDLALAQIAALGATYAFYLGHDPMSNLAYLYSLGFTSIGAVLFSITRRQKQNVPQEAIIGISYAVAAGAAILLVDLARDPHGGEKIQYLLVGNLVWVSWREVLKITAVCAGVGLFHLLCRRQFNLVTFHPEDAEAEGVSIRLWDFLFYLSFGVAITSIVRVTGVLLIFSYLIIPATIGTLYAEGIRGRVLIGWCVGLGVSFLGLLFSYDRPSGPMIVTIFGLSLIVFGGVRFFTRSQVKKQAATVLGGIAAGLMLLLIGVPTMTGPAEDNHGHEAEHGHGSGDDHHGKDQAVPESKVGQAAPSASIEKPGEPEEFKKLKSPDAVIREAAVDALSNRTDSPALDALAAALKKEPDDGLKLKIALILHRHRSNDGLRALVSLLRDSEVPFVRMEAIHLLEEIAGGTFGYDGVKSPSENAEALKRWQEWMGKVTTE